MEPLATPNQNHSSRSYRLRPEVRVSSALLATSTCLFIYIATARHTAGGEQIFAESPIDPLIPTSALAIIPYVYMYAQAWSPLVILADRRMMFRWYGSLMLLYGLAVPIWIMFPVCVPRPDLIPTEIWTYCLAIIVEMDPPTNCLPSMHVAAATSAALIVKRVDPKLGTFQLGAIVVIWWSTVALGQHWVIDGALGLMMALMVDYVMFTLYPLPANSLYRTNKVWDLIWIVVTPLIFIWGAWFYISGRPPEVAAAILMGS